MAELERCILNRAKGSLLLLQDSRTLPLLTIKAFIVSDNEVLSSCPLSLVTVFDPKTIVQRYNLAAAVWD
jgi:hypothetical protein